MQSILSLFCMTVFFLFLYKGTGMDVPYWKFGGSTVISSNYVRLTPDRQSKKGMIWNTVVSLNQLLSSEFKSKGRMLV